MCGTALCLTSFACCSVFPCSFSILSPSPLCLSTWAPPSRTSQRSVPLTPRLVPHNGYGETHNGYGETPLVMRRNSLLCLPNQAVWSRSPVFFSPVLCSSLYLCSGCSPAVCSSQSSQLSSSHGWQKMPFRKPSMKRKRMGAANPHLLRPTHTITTTPGNSRALLRTCLTAHQMQG